MVQSRVMTLICHVQLNVLLEWISPSLDSALYCKHLVWGLNLSFPLGLQYSQRAEVWCSSSHGIASNFPRCLLIWTGSFGIRHTMEMLQIAFLRFVYAEKQFCQGLCSLKEQWNANLGGTSVHLIFFPVCLNNSKKYVVDFPMLLVITQRCISSTI